MTEGDLQCVLDLIDEDRERARDERARREKDDDIEIIMSDRPSDHIPEEATCE